MNQSPKSSELRIIGGRWRGRRVRFAAVPGLRPTPDRVRETLFNWLSPVIEGACCLDLFAGSGALAFEALSRGARHAVMVDSHPRVIENLRASIAALEATDTELVRADALAFLQREPRRFDVVFVDPPFTTDLIGECCKLLEARGWLSSHAAVYIEMARKQGLPPVPANWTLVRSKQAGEVGYHLAMRYA